ncbi:MAG: D-aminoacyl-tRNA deacylase [Steroidobacterales bacterium]
MIALLQRVTAASVCIERIVTAQIGRGVVALIGIERHDEPAAAGRLLERMLNYRLFADAAGRMNLSLRDTGAGLLLVPQFTLAADTARGNRPGFSRAAAPQVAADIFQHLIELARAQHAQIACGRFGADMQVSLTNDGPVTFWLQDRPPD